MAEDIAGYFWFKSAVLAAISPLCAAALLGAPACWLLLGLFMVAIVVLAWAIPRFDQACGYRGVWLNRDWWGHYWYWRVC